MQKSPTEKPVNEASAKLPRVAKTKATCAGATVVGFDGAGEPQTADVVVRMGRVIENRKNSRL